MKVLWSLQAVDGMVSCHWAKSIPFAYFTIHNLLFMSFHAVWPYAAGGMLLINATINAICGCV
jgi:hypothetical protein